MSSKIQYSSIGKSVDGTTYCSGVETLAENIIEDNEADATLVFPSKTGWASMRSSSYLMTTENAEAVLPLPIYKIVKVLVKFDNIYFSYGTGGAASWRNYLDEYQKSDGTVIDYVDITDFVLEKTEWMALSIADGDADSAPYIGGKYKDNTFYWEQGLNNIPFLGTVYERGVLFQNDDTPTYERLARSSLYNAGNDYKNEYNQTLSSVLDGGYILTMTTDVRDWKFRIEYIPLSSKTKIRARKNALTKEEYIQPFNQRAEMNAASAFGKNMYLTAQKTGVREITVVKDHTRLSDIPPLGALVRHNGKRYRLVANHYVQTNTRYIRVTHTLSENWSNKSKHVAVDQKYRNWEIPQDILWRNLYLEDYLRVGTTKKTDLYNTIQGIWPASMDLLAIMRIFDTSSSSDKTIDSLCWYGGQKTETEGEFTFKKVGVTVPCSTYGIGNSMIFSATMKDNLSAGLSVSIAVDSGEFVVGDYCTEALYCFSSGTTTDVRIVLSDGIEDEEYVGEEFGAVASAVYPNMIEISGGGYEKTGLNSPQTTLLFDRTFDVYKDAREAIKFTYQIHLVGEDECFFGNKFAENNPLVKDWGSEDRAFRFWLLTKYVREGTDLLETVDGDVYYEHTADDKCFSYSSIKLEPYCFIFELADKIKALDKSKYVAWAITDENDNLYVGCNDASVSTLYFQLHHVR